MKSLKENIIEVSSRTPSKGETTIKVITVEKVEKAVLKFEKYFIKLDNHKWDLLTQMPILSIEIKNQLENQIKDIQEHLEKYKKIFGDWKK